jgi:hypothetical protein
VYDLQSKGPWKSLDFVTIAYFTSFYPHDCAALHCGHADMFKNEKIWARGVVSLFDLTYEARE